MAIIVPLLMWSFLGIVGTISILQSSPSITFYISNKDTSQITLSEEFILPFDFDGLDKGELIVSGTNSSLSNYLVQMIKWNALNNNSSGFYNANIVENKSDSELNSLLEDGDIQYWLQIDDSFSANYSNLGQSLVVLNYQHNDLVSETSSIVIEIAQILNYEPFTIVDTSE